MDTRNLSVTATPIIEEAVQRAALGDEVWWDLAPTLAPTPEGPIALHVLFLYIRSPLLGQAATITTFLPFEDPLDLLNVEGMTDAILRAVTALKDHRSQMLTQSIITSNGHQPG